MLGIKRKYHKKTIQFFFFKVVLLLNVFAFSGFNGQAQSTHIEPAKTELLESRGNASIYKLFDFQKHRNKVISFRFLLGISSYSHPWDLLNINTFLSIKYKSIYKEYLSYKDVFIKLSTQILPSFLEDGTPSFSFN